MTYFRANTEKVVFRIVDGEAVLVHADTSAYYGLNATGTYVWQAIVEDSLAPEEIAQRLGAEYGIGHDDAVTGDIEAFLAMVGREALVVQGLRSDARSDGKLAASDGGRAPGRYEAPKLTRFGELEKLVLSGE